MVCVSTGEQVMSSPFTMSIEESFGNSKQHGFHLGTDEKLAREIVQDKFKARVSHNIPTVTIALMRDKRIVDVFYGDKWSSDFDID
jgi:hypothetical protein